MRWLVAEGIRWIYRGFLSPLIHALAGPGMGCRFEPTCSVYAEEAIRTHGVIQGGRLALNRLSRCHPWSDGGSDPVPAPNSSRKA